MKKLLLVLLICCLMFIGCYEDILEKYLPFHPGQPIPKKMWDNADCQWTIVLNNKVYLHQMRKRVNANGVECQFVLIKEK